ncbi:MAG: Hsp70 family protein [Comamonas sp.]
MSPVSPSALLGIDFGTSNSAMAFKPDAAVAGPSQLLQAEGVSLAMPTAVFFNTEEHRTHFGRDAVARYLEGTEGRLMRSLKSLLGSALIQEKTVVQGQLMAYQDIVAMFVRQLAATATRQLGALPATVVMGRPVHFVDGNAARDTQAQNALEQAARAAGFADVRFQLEPIAAALDYEQRITREAVVLVVDIGGGTSDFTVVRLGPQRMHRADRADDILATTGVHIGGTDFDRRLSLQVAMPLLGLGHVGSSGREVPSGVFHDLSTWHLIQWLYTAPRLRDAQALRSNYRDTALHDRLMRLLHEHWGHRLANAVEEAKIAVSSQHSAQRLDVEWLEAALSPEVTPASLQQCLQALLVQVADCALHCVQLAGLQQAQIDAIYLTGGSSALQPLRAALAQVFSGIPQVEGDLFGGVAAGLVHGQTL